MVADVSLWQHHIDIVCMDCEHASDEIGLVSELNDTFHA